MRINCFLIAGFFLFTTCHDTAPTDKKASPNFVALDPAAAGIDFVNQLTHDESFNIYLYKSFYNGAGVGMGDFNRDGLLDVFLCGNQVDNKLYLNQGDLSFKDVTEAAGVASSGAWSTGVSVVDINSDGWPDIYVCKSGKPEGANRRNELFIHTGQLDNQGHPLFKESAAAYGIDDLGFSVHAGFLDYDRDGDLDMYLLNNSVNPSEVILNAKKGLRKIYDENGGNKLYRNDGQGFTDVTRQAGIYGSAIGFGLGVGIGDLNRDGWPDIYVANDFFEKDYLYLNQKDGTFRECLEELMSEISLGAMGVDIADLNNDGFPEVFVTEMLPASNRRQKTKAVFDSWDTYALKERNGYHRQFPRNSLQLNRGPGKDGQSVHFSEISRLAGVAATDWSWGVHLLDLDNSGHKEIFITNGIVKDLLDQDYIDFYNDPAKLREIYQQKGVVIEELVDNIPSEPISNFLYQQDTALHFRDSSPEWGLDHPAFSTGAAFGDLDNDGDLDLIVNNLNAPPFLYRNESRQLNDHHYLNIQLQGAGSNADAIGAQLTIHADGATFFQELYPMRGTMSTMDKRLHFGLGNIDKIDSLLVHWPDGTCSSLTDVTTDQFLIIQQPTRLEQTFLPDKPAEPFLFKQVPVSESLFAGHTENQFIDFDRERLLFESVATEGPALAVGDLNQDGLADVYLGGAAGFPGQLFLQDKGGQFVRKEEAVFTKDQASEDVDAVFADIDNDGDLDLLVSSGGYEFSPNSFALANRIYLNDGRGHFTRSPQLIPNGKLNSTSCIRPADVDGDGDLDLFVGSRFVPMAYGLAPDSYLLLNDGKGHFSAASETQASGLKALGMVTDAVWMDYDRDGDEDLIVVGDWMSIHLFENQGGNLTDVREESGLAHTAGFWKVVKAADLDGDGYEDLIVGNLGQNTFFKASNPARPVRMHLNDYDGNGDIDHLISVYNGDQAYPLATKKELTKQLPFLLKKYLKYADYSDQTITDIFSKEQLEHSIVLEVTETSSMVFLNKAGKFYGQALPMEAQFAPVYAVCTEDFNGDGQPDLLLGGNQHLAKPQTGIYAASYGQYLLGTGRSTFETVPPGKSGFWVDGQTRSLCAIRDARNRQLVLVARNNDILKVFEY